MLGLYIHVPFCSAICHYCNFNRGLFDEGLKQRYVDAVVADIHGAPARHGWAPGRQAADSVFFVGGTASLLDAREIHAIVHAC
ncbi:MAG: coproporphyrinogen III oxidase family protein, partial [Acidobacteria bacterium]|nr:coproporphyrinogen III oxidase family protein [Acidobacteriota bacterium]